MDHTPRIHKHITTRSGSCLGHNSEDKIHVPLSQCKKSWPLASYRANRVDLYDEESTDEAGMPDAIGFLIRSIHCTEQAKRPRRRVPDLGPYHMMHLTLCDT